MTRRTRRRTRQEEADEEEEEQEEEEEATDIKSNNPHLAGGEKLSYRVLVNMKQASLDTVCTTDWFIWFLVTSPSVFFEPYLTMFTKMW